MQKLWILVATLGIAVLVFGIIFIVMAGSARTEVLDGLKDEGFPVFEYDETNYPYLSVTTASATEGDIIDTAEEIDAAADALDEARYKMAPPPVGAAGFGLLFAESTFPAELAPPDAGGVTADTLVFHEYSAIIGFSSVINGAKGGLATATLIQFIGIVTILVGVALIAGGLILTKVGSKA